MQLFTGLLALAATAVPFVAQAAPLPDQSADPIPGKYIILLQPEANVSSIAAHHNKVREIHRRNIGRRDVDGIEHEYNMGEFKGYSGSFDEATVEELKNEPEVLLVEQDAMMSISALTSQSNAVWGLGSLSSRTRGSTTYYYDTTAGQGTYSYVVDTGIRTSHRDFGGRASFGFNAVRGSRNNADTQGHGTHVAGTIGSSTYGAAKRTNLIAVKVFEGRQGTTSDVIAGFEWAANDIISKSRTNTAVINMSLGGEGSAIWDRAITAAYSRGVLAVVAAGNENQDAARRSPARSPEALTVGNIQRNDVRAPSSNYGSAVDIWAAGTDVVSTYYTSDTATASLTGTSMASPYVAGLVSYLRGLEGPSSASAIRSRVLSLATTGRVSGGQGAANRLAYNGSGR